MNVAFWLILFLGAIFLWFLLSKLYRPIGKYLSGLYKESKEQMQDETQM